MTTDIYGEGYRRAEAKDVGRTDVEVNDSTNNLPWLGPRKLFAIEKGNWPFLAGDVDGNVKATWELARVPILPEECEHKCEWPIYIDEHGKQFRVACITCGAPPKSRITEVLERLREIGIGEWAGENPEEVLAEIRGGERTFDTGKVSREELLEMLKDPSKWVTLDELCSLPLVTIRRKLEAGGEADAEQAILISGRYYPLSWIQSSPGVNPQQVEIVI